MSDTWSDIQAHKKQLHSLRERLQRRRREPGAQTETVQGVGAGLRSDSPVLPAALPPSKPSGLDQDEKIDPLLEKRLLEHLSNQALLLPTDSLAIQNTLLSLQCSVTQGNVESLLQKFAAQELIEVRGGLSQDGMPTTVTFADHTKLSAMLVLLPQEGEPSPPQAEGGQKRRAQPPPVGSAPSPPDRKPPEPAKKSRKVASELDLEIERLLNQQSTKERQSKKMSQEILELLNTSTAKEQSMVEKFRSRGRAQVQEFCDHGTKLECMRAQDLERPCRKLHFRRIINKHTDESLGDCSFLNTCFHMDTCKYVHYEIDSCLDTGPVLPLDGQGSDKPLTPSVGTDPSLGKLFPPQWICCDIRFLDVSILGKFAVVMADPPWDIHMELPYGTLTDDEMRRLNIPVLQDDGFLFLWVTGRAMELGRECLNLWGYERVDEIIWVKTNQLQRIIRTGRTGHWLNHGKEHCLVGVKGNPQGFNRGLDCDVIVAEVRSTSHKPDEIYGMIERLSPGTRKIELFGRPHNVQPNWITLGNQLDGIHLLDPDVVARFKKRYPDGVITKCKMV
ncbi:N6-adenosine-methyltransferase subunit METTL3-like isoform X1 [Hypanus sabinus]|uniref:N6-adenosine-methyltransferase subunit METTL3-like isoform X1 n=2 Tax=Myliobatiformes TaxID=117851 RepID=UPI0028C3AB81|nr:N6-adenosine-methyltransferase subunit METTL3-like isoform X1 [Hypanus sabinus]